MLPEEFSFDAATDAKHSQSTGSPRGRRATGIAAIVLALVFNIPYATLASIYDYPGILRASPAEALDRFAAGGSFLILVWHDFAMAALALAPLSIALAITPTRLRTAPALAIGAAITGAMAGLAQAIGLWRWVFVVPQLARTHVDPASPPSVRAAAERAFELLNAYGGVAIGEHLGQVLTAMFVAMLATLQWRERARATAITGFVTALALVVGTNEGLAMALGDSGDAFALATIAGFLGLTGWLIATGIGLLRRPAR